jgi:hypothetical protein
LRAISHAKVEAHRIDARAVRQEGPRLAQIDLRRDERLTLDGALRQLDFLGAELDAIDRMIAEDVVGDPEVRRLMTIPGVDAVTAMTWSR